MLLYFIQKQNLTSLTLRNRAQSLASDAMASQSTDFQRYGVWGNWSAPYATFHPTYEAQQLKVFGEMVRKGYIYRGKKPVHWSPSSQTALAEAELEYPPGHMSKSIYVGFQVLSCSPVLSTIRQQLPCKDIKIAVWTTTPWTLPANQAVAVNPNLIYCIVAIHNFQNGTHFLVAKDLVKTFIATISKSRKEDDKIISDFKVFGEITGSELVGTEYQHPVHESQKHRIVIGGAYVTSESGTGLVHTAPGHGMDDFITGQREQLDIVSPVDDYGRFTKEAGEALFGKEVLKEGNTMVIEMLKDKNLVLHVDDYEHKYPYDWRTGKPTITRTTEQWFASVEAFRDEAMKCIEKVTWVPAIGQKRLSSMTLGRKDWCISRQRSWGLPIPVFYHKSSDEFLMTEETICHVENIFRKRGSDSWWELEVEDLLPPNLKHLASSYVKGSDTMDVWFDSGCSWAGVLRERTCSADRSEMFPADLYLEGSDQHRGWFQSSLLTSVATTGIAPYKSVLTHGFVLDEKGHKMSKSLGNVVDPCTIINGGKNLKTQPAYGADTLRLWVAGVDYTSDVGIGDGIIKQSSDTYRKLRNTLRFLLGSVSDFDPIKDAVEYEQLPSLDKFILGKLTEVFKDVDQSYSSYQFYKAINFINQYAIQQLSNFYLDICKDRLYISNPSDSRRRSCQTTIRIIFEQFVLMMAPLVPHMAEDAFQNLLHSGNTSSVFELGWLHNQTKYMPHNPFFWDFVVELRDDVNQCIEKARRDKYIGSSQECEVFLCVIQDSVTFTDEKISSLREMIKKVDPFSEYNSSDLSSSVDDLRFIFLVSQVHIVESVDEIMSNCSKYHLKNLNGESETGVVIGVRKAEGNKCNRCWYYSKTVEDNSEEVIFDKTDRRDLCSRCFDILRRNC